MKTYKKPIARIIELQSESIICQSLSAASIKGESDDKDDIGVNNHRVKLWED